MHIVGSIVVSKYNNRAYVVEGIDFQMNPMNKFSYKNKTGDQEIEISFVDY